MEAALWSIAGGVMEFLRLFFGASWRGALGF